MATLAPVAVNSELVTFKNDPTSDSQCGLSRMLAWTWPSVAGFGQQSQSQPFWPANASTGTNITSVNIAVLALNTSIPNNTNLPSNAYGLTALILDTAMLVGFAMLYNQLAVFKGVSTIGTHDPIVDICVGAVGAASALSVIPGPDQRTGVPSIDSFLSSASDAVSSFLGTADTSTVPLASTLGVLIPRMFTPFWTLAYYCSYGDGRMPDATFYDQRYAPIVIASAFDSWIGSLSVASSNSGLLDVSTWLSDARDAFAAGTEGPTNINSFFGATRNVSTSATNNIDTLIATNDQFERRRSSIGALSDNLLASNKRTDFALTTMILWVVTVVAVLSVAGVLIVQKNFSSLSVLIITTITLLIVDSMWRAVVSSTS